MNIVKDIAKKSIIKNKNCKNLEFLNKRYYCDKKIAVGGLSVIYKGIDIYSEYFNKDSNIVIKIPSEELLKKEDISAFVYAEYTFLRRLNLDTIVKIFDFGIDKKTNIPYLVLEHIEGKLLNEISINTMCRKTKNLIFKSLLNSLNYIHSKNIIHADIAPTNIILNANNIPIIFDFGISQNIEDNDFFCLEYKKVKAFNPKYSAPELLINNNSKPTISSDIFSLAVVMYEIYCNKPLFIITSEELIDLPIEKRNLSQIPFFLRNWFRNSLSLDIKKRKITKKLTFFNNLNYF